MNLNDKPTFLLDVCSLLPSGLAIVHQMVEAWVQGNLCLI